MSKFSFGASSLVLPVLGDLQAATTRKSFCEPSKAYAGHGCQELQDITLAAFALLVEAYINSPDISFLHGSHSGTHWDLQGCSISIGHHHSIKELLSGVRSGVSVLDQVPDQAPCMLLRTEDVGNLPRDIDIHCGLVLAYSSNPSHGSFPECVHYDPSVMSLQSARRLLSQFVHIRRQITSMDRTSSLDAVDILSEEDADQISELNAIPEEKDWRTINQRIAVWTSQDANKLAVTAWDGQLTRGQLDDASHLLARFLARQGCGRGQIVAIIMPRCTRVPVAMVAVLKAGAAFVILDQGLPVERLRAMISIISCSFVLSSMESASLATQLVSNVIAVEENGMPVLVSAQGVFGPRSFPVFVSPDDLAIISFTSGSTGKPKAVAWQHFAICSVLKLGTIFPGRPEISSLHRTSYSFAWATLEILTSLMNGGVLCVPSDDELSDDLRNAIRRLEPQWMAIPPSLAKSLDPRKLPSLEAVDMIGEPGSATLRKTWLDNQVRRLENHYGSTEAGISACLALSLLSDSQSIGKCVGKRGWVVDPKDHDRLMPVGAIGELILEGYGIAKEYILEPEKTSAAFIQSPKWASSFGAGQGDRRWFKTGDLVRYDGRGEFLLLGRKDFQVKLRGQRIEPSEVEESIKQALGMEIVDVIVDITLVANDPFKQRLTAFMILRWREHTDEYVGELQRKMTACLSQRLPSFMIPAKVIVLEAFPKTASGKLSRRALRELGQDATLSEGVDSSPSPKSIQNDEYFFKLRKAWSETLHVDATDLSYASNWTELGGDSASAVMLSRKAREAGFSINMSDILQFPNMMELLQRIKQSNSKNGFSKPRDRGSFARVAEGTWYSTTSFQRYCASMSSSSHRSLILYHILTMRGSVDVQKLRNAVSLIFQRYDSLRLTFTHDGAKQMALPASDPQILQRIKIVECNDVNEGVQTLLAQLQSLEKSSGNQPVTWMILVSSSQVKVLTSMHHNIVDGTSMGLILRALQKGYETGEVSFPEVQFLPYLEKRLLPQVSDSYEYWRDLLEGSKPTMLRKDGMALANDNGEISDISAKRIVVLPTALPAGATLSTLVKSAWAIMLARMVSSYDVVFYYLVNGRDEAIPGSSSVVGCCATEVPMRVRISDTMTVASLLKQVQSQVLAALPHAHLGADSITRECAPQWCGDVKYRHSSFLLHQNFDSAKHFTLGDKAYVDVEMICVDDSIMDFSITSSALGNGGLEVVLEASKRWYSQEEVDLVMNALVRVLGSLSRDPDMPLAQCLKDADSIGL